MFALSYLIYAWIPFIVALVFQMLKEKEARIKETMFIMGFQPRLFWLGYASSFTARIMPLTHFADGPLWLLLAALW
jgi:hypothetical protein